MSNKFAIYPSLQGAVFLVSGGASGIGADIVAAAHAQGAKVAFLDIMENEGRAIEKNCPGSLFIKCDVTDIPSLQKSVSLVRENLGPVRVLVNNAANDDRRLPEAVDEAYWNWSMDVNLKHQFFLAQAVLPHMKELGGGSIINFSSIAWRFGADSMSVYATAKSAVVGLTRMLSRNYGPYNVRVNAVEPGAVLTEKQRRVWHTTQEAVDRLIGFQRIKRMLTADEVARTVMFLASEDSRMITGQSIAVDAGAS